MTSNHHIQRIMRNRTLPFVAILTLTCIAPVSGAVGQTIYGIESGTTSITLHKAALDTVNYTITGTSGTTTPAADYAAGFSIDTTTSAEQMFMFTADPEFTPGAGIIEHTGTFEINSVINLGNFVVEFDDTRMTEANSGFFVTDGADLADQVLFDIGNPVSNTFNGTEWHAIDSNLYVAPEFASFLGDAALTGQDFGDLRLDALTLIKSGEIPEPSTALLMCFGGLAVIARRRR